MKKFYLTTPIFYPNGEPHLGHAYTLVIADAIVRYKKSRNFLVFFQTGTDEHGEKIVKTAKELNIDTKELIEKNILAFKKLFSFLNVSEYFFYRTNTDEHKKKVLKSFFSLLKKKDIYEKEYEGNYCTICEDYTKKKECPSCLKTTLPIKEPAFFFRTTKYYSWLKETINENKFFIIPERIKKEIIKNFLSEDIRDLCVTRRKGIGIKITEEDYPVVYVWFDALLNYLRDDLFHPNEKDECEIVHLIGKDISRFHCIYWPIMLKSLGFSLPNKILVHGWILNSNQKMSKSLGNVINPMIWLKKYPTDLLRAFFFSQIVFLSDGTINEEELIIFYKSFFINQLGNLVNRVNKMIFLYNNGLIPKIDLELVKKNPLLSSFLSFQKEILEDFQKKMDNYQLTVSFNLIRKLISQSNQLINQFSPWKLIEQEEKLVKSLLNCLVGCIRFSSFLLSFFLPETNEKILEVFNISDIESNWENCLDLIILNDRLIKKESVIFKKNYQ